MENTLLTTRSDAKAMQRRTYLAALAALGIAGCSGSNEPTASEPSTTNGPPSNTAQEDSAQSLNVIVEDITVIPPSDHNYYSVPVAEPRITNTGEAATRRFFITVNWFDKAGNLLGSSSETRIRMRTLAADETWLPRLDPSWDVDRPSAVDSAEIGIGEVDPAAVGSERVRPDESNKRVAELDPDGIAVSEKTLDVSNGQVNIRGSVTNNRQSEVGYLETVVKAHNADEAVIGWDYIDDSDVGAGETVYYDTDVDTGGRADAAEEASVSIATDRLDC